MVALLTPSGRSRVLPRVVALLCGGAVAGVPAAHSLTEVAGSGPRIEAEHTVACPVAHDAGLCAAAAGVLIARPAAGPGVRPSSSIDHAPRADAPPMRPSAPLLLTPAARAPPTL